MSTGVVESKSVVPAVDSKDAAEFAGLRHVSDSRPGIRRRKSGTGFTYMRPDGARLAEPLTLRRIRSLAVPPAWTEVWICPSADGHIQATGRDARGRKQYCYHPMFREVRDGTKYERVIVFADMLPAMRATVREHMALRGLPRRKVLATVVHLLETTLIRVGNDDYARQNKSYGLTTLKNRHVAVDGAEVRFRFTGKGGKQWSLKVKDRRVARIIKGCQDLPGQELLQYVDDDGQCQDVTSSDVNAYLREITGQDITAKDFRTWAGTVMAALALHASPAADNVTAAKRTLRDAIVQVAARLGNTPTICRKCYIHPDIVDAYLDGSFELRVRSGRRSETALQPEESAVLAMLRRRLKRTKAAARGPPASALEQLRASVAAVERSEGRAA